MRRKRKEMLKKMMASFVRRGLEVGKKEDAIN